MGEPTRADREAVVKAMHLDGASMQVRKWVSGEWSHGGFVFGYYAEQFAQSLADQRAELLRLAAEVAVKVGEHEYARGREGFRRQLVDACHFETILEKADGKDDAEDLFHALVDTLFRVGTGLLGKP